MITYIYSKQRLLSWQSVIYVFAEARPSATILSAITRRCKSTCSSSELLSVALRVHAKKCRNTAMSTGLCPKMGCVHRIAIFGNMTIHQWIFGVLVTTMLSGQATSFWNLTLKGPAFGCEKTDSFDPRWSKLNVSQIYVRFDKAWEPLQLQAFPRGGHVWCSMVLSTSGHSSGFFAEQRIKRQDLQLIAQLETDVQAKSAQITKWRTQFTHTL